MGRNGFEDDTDELRRWLGEVSPNWDWDAAHLRLIQAELGRVTAGLCDRLMLFLPPIRMTNAEDEGRRSPETPSRETHTEPPSQACSFRTAQGRPKGARHVYSPHHRPPGGRPPG